MTLIQLLAQLLYAASFSGTVVSVQDGDTLTVQSLERTVRVRLSGLDCPERNQPFGRDALAFTTDLALGRTATIIEESRDRYGRVVASVVLADGRNLNEQIVAAGLAWWYRTLAPYNRTLEALESEARHHRRGLWAEEQPTPPWEWRRQDHRPARSQRRSEPRSERRDTRRFAR